MTKVKRVEESDVKPVKSTASEKGNAKFYIELSEPDFSPIRKLKINGYFMSDGNYFWGFNPEEAPNHWVIRIDFRHFNFDVDVDYKVGSGGFSALLIQGGEEMISGGWAINGTMRLEALDPDKGIIKGGFRHVETEGGRPDGSDMPPAYAKHIRFETVLEKV